MSEHESPKVDKQTKPTVLSFKVLGAMPDGKEKDDLQWQSERLVHVFYDQSSEAMAETFSLAEYAELKGLPEGDLKFIYRVAYRAIASNCVLSLLFNLVDKNSPEQALLAAEDWAQSTVTGLKNGTTHKPRGWDSGWGGYSDEQIYDHLKTSAKAIIGYERLGIRRMTLLDNLVEIESVNERPQ